MSSISKVSLATLLGIFFSVATLEIDIFDCESDFFDAYDSLVKIDSKVTQRILYVEFTKIVSTEFVQPTFIASAFISTGPLKEPRSSNYFYRPKLFLIKSSFLI